MTTRHMWRLEKPTETPGFSKRWRKPIHFVCGKCGLTMSTGGERTLSSSIERLERDGFTTDCDERFVCTIMDD